MYTDFLRSVGISPVSWIMLRSLVMSLMPNLPRAVSIFGGISQVLRPCLFKNLFKSLLNFSLIIIDDRWWASVIMVQLCDVFSPSMDTKILTVSFSSPAHNILSYHQGSIWEKHEDTIEP